MSDTNTVQLSTIDFQNLIQIVGSHPTPQGVASKEGQEKIRLINVLSQLLAEIDHK